MKKQLEASNMERRLAAQRLEKAIGKNPSEPVRTEAQFKPDNKRHTKAVKVAMAPRAV